jgi:rhodanese-related sulfurtransferase
MQRTPLFLLPVIALTVSPLLPLRASACSDEEHVTYFHAADLAKELQASDLRVFDANSEETWRKGHVPGAVHVSYKQVSSAVLPADKATRLVFYCKNTQCTASHVAAARASELGYAHVFVMPEGIDGWTAQGLPLEKAEKAGKARADG